MPAPTRVAARLDLLLQRADHALMGVGHRGRWLAIALTLVSMVLTALPHVPRAFVDYDGVPWLRGIDQRETFGTDTIADMYEARVVLNDPADMYVKAKVEQTPLEAATWSKDASAPYPPALLLAEAALYRVGEWVGVGLYGMVLLLAVVFLALSLAYAVRTRWYLFPLLYLNSSYIAERFVAVQDGSYLIMLVVVVAALWLARAGRDASHLLMALAIAMKLSPLAYLWEVRRMTRRTAVACVVIVLGGLALPYFVWDNYLYIYRFANETKGSPLNALAAALFVGPLTIALWYVASRLGFDAEDRIGWSLVPLATWLALEMNSPRHLLIVLLVPDKRVTRNLAVATALASYSLFSPVMRFGSTGPIAVAVLTAAVLVWLDRIGWDVVWHDFRAGCQRLSLSGILRS